jgi:predicted  nucleic acid-binding Zn-ribbon protein
VTSFDALLEIQSHDTRLDQLRHQLEALPERKDRDALVARLAAIGEQIGQQQEARATLARDQKRLDDEIESVGARRSHEEATLYGGTITNARALQDLQEEIDSLGRRITVLEDQDLEIMEKIEPIDALLTELEKARGESEAALESAEQALTVAEAELAVQVGRETDARSALVDSVDGALLAEYEKIRQGSGGIGVARMVGTQCGGCHLGLSAVEVARIRKMGPGELTHCEECGRLLVP